MTPRYADALVPKKADLHRRRQAGHAYLDLGASLPGRSLEEIGDQRLRLRALRRHAHGNRVPLSAPASTWPTSCRRTIAQPPPRLPRPGHGTPPRSAAKRRPIGPGSSVLQDQDGGRCAGGGRRSLAIAQRTRTLLIRRGYRVSMTRTGPVFRYARRQHRTRPVLQSPACSADAPDPCRRLRRTPRCTASRRCIPPGTRAGRDDIYARSLKAARLVQAAAVRATGAADLGLISAPT